MGSGKNWKTTACGVLAGISALTDIGQQLLSGGMDTTHLMTDWAAISAAAGLLFAKDHNVTGGDTHQ